MFFSKNISEKIFCKYNNRHENLSFIIDKFYANQVEQWKELSNATTNLSQIKTREISCDGYKVKIQFNPKRIVNTTANISDNYVKTRKCVLCVNNLFLQQKGILYYNNYLILCNPAPILEKHFTFVSIKHKKQSIKKHFELLLDLSKDVSEKYSVLYNGPKCGASSPDHFHFQIVPFNNLPIENDLTDKNKILLKTINLTNIFTIHNYDRAVLILESANKIKLEKVFTLILKTIQNISQTKEEPMINIICNHKNNVWQVIIFLRKKHRPSIYFANEDDRVIVSPGSIDMCGLIITPIEKDFLKLDNKIIEQIFKEVSEQQDFSHKIIEMIK